MPYNEQEDKNKGHVKLPVKTQRDYYPDFKFIFLLKAKIKHMKLLV